MTGPEMNARSKKADPFTVMTARCAVGLALMAGLALSAGGCASGPGKGSTSPLAPDVQALVDANRQYPRWADFPRVTEPVPEPQVIAAQVNALEGASSQLTGQVSQLEWTVDDAEAYAAAVAARVDSAEMSPVSAETLAEIEAFNRQARERGRPPPPVDRR